MTTRSKGSELLQTDQHFYRSCILYEAICETPVEDAYKRMKTVMPNVNFLDFDYWYYRFLNGNVDLDHDRSADPKTRGFSDMPIDVVENIVGNLDLVDKLSTRKVCRNLRAVIDKQQTKFQNVSIEITKKISEKSCEIQFEQQKIEYSAHKNGSCFLKTAQKTISLTEGDHWMMAMKDFSSVITNPKWSFENIDICFSCTKKRIRQFKSMVTGYKIRVKKLRIEADSVDQVIDLIPIFDANILESIDFGDSKIEQDAMEKIFEMDQWNNARELKLRKFPVEWFSMKNLVHFKKFEITRHENTDDSVLDILPEIRDNFFKSPIFEYCAFTFDYSNCGDDDFEQEHFLARESRFYYEDIDEVMGEHAAYDIDNRQYQIEGSNDYFDFSCSLNGEYIMKYEIKRVHN